MKRTKSTLILIRCAKLDLFWKRLVWNLGKFVTVDEMMVRYKGSYCPACQYMPKKPEKWGLKLWCLADSSSKFISNFDVYCGKSMATLEEPRSARGESNLSTRVVLDLTSDIHEKGHIVVMNNYSSIELFNALEEKGTYGTIRSNRIGLPHLLADMKQFNRNPQGTLDWSFHESRKIAYTIWKDKKSVLLLSSHALPVNFPCEKIHTNFCL
jgi:hypothetical protein